MQGRSLEARWGGASRTVRTGRYLQRGAGLAGMIGAGLWGRAGYGTREARSPGNAASGGAGAKRPGQRRGHRGERRPDGGRSKK